LHRKILEWEWFDHPNAFRLFIYILLKANYEPKKWHGIDIGRGQLLTSLATISKETGMSVRSIRTSLTSLKSTNELTSQTTSKYSLLTVVKYEEYQARDQDATSQTTSGATNERQASDKQTTTTKETKNIKNIKKQDEGLDLDFLRYKGILISMRGSTFITKEELAFKSQYERDNPEKIAI